MPATVDLTGVAVEKFGAGEHRRDAIGTVGSDVVGVGEVTDFGMVDLVVHFSGCGGGLGDTTAWRRSALCRRVRGTGVDDESDGDGEAEMGGERLLDVGPAFLAALGVRGVGEAEHGGVAVDLGPVSTGETDPGTLGKAAED